MVENNIEASEGSEEDDKNPFQLPSDQDVFLKRVKDRQKHQRKKKQWRRLKIWEKTAASNSVALIPKQNPSKHINSTKCRPKTHIKPLLGERRRERENITDFIKKKREMFLLQMSLDTKREEIRKLEEKALLREQAITKSELMLEQDATRFEQFLRKNDNDAAKAVQLHEQEAKKKQECAQAIKRLNNEISKEKSEIEKYKELLKDCKQYKEFLDSLTPPQWFEERKKNKQRKDKLIREYNLKIEVQRKRREQRAEQRKLAEEEGNEELEVLEDSPDIEDLPKEVYEQEPTMYFTDPQQLFDIFSSLEKKNLFLIQNVQETEEALDELKQEAKMKKKFWNGKTSALDANIEELQEKILTQKEKAQRLEVRAEMQNSSLGMNPSEQQNLKQDLAGKVEQVFKECGFFAEQTPNTLEQLQKIEEHLEILISSLEEMPEDIRRVAEKKAENERRNRQRKEKIKRDEEHHQNRLKKQIERAKRVEEHVKKHRRGKPNMFRSKPMKRKVKKKSVKVLAAEEAERLNKKYFC